MTKTPKLRRSARTVIYADEYRILSARITGAINTASPMPPGRMRSNLVIGGENKLFIGRGTTDATIRPTTASNFFSK
jgi:hypothetical protein